MVNVKLHIMLRVIFLGSFTYFLKYWWDSEFQVVDIIPTMILIVAGVNEYYYQKKRKA